jgi:hypothetical protein
MPAAPLRAKKKVLLSKIETTEQVDPIPTVGANAVLVKNFELTPMEMELVARDNIKPYFGNDEDVPVVIYAKVSFEVELTGSGTAGVVPPIGQLLRAAGMSETALAAAQTGTSAAGGAATITLAAGASATDNAYVGMTINLTGGTGSGQSGVIQSYVGASKQATVTGNWTTPPDVTTTYAIPAQVVYRRVTDSLESITHYAYFDAVLHKLIGARGTVSFMLPYKKVPTAKFAFTGVYVPVTDAAAPAANFATRQKPLAVNAANTSAISLLGYTGVVLQDLSIDLANEIVFRSLPGGGDSVVMTDSNPAGSITQQATTIAVKDWWTAIKSVTTGLFSITHGTVAGNKFKLDAPRTQLTKPSYSEGDNVQMLQTSMKFLPVAGNDELTLTFL